MKLIILFLIIFLEGCYTPKDRAVITPSKTTVDTALISKPASIEPLLDTTSLRITVVHNPKYPNRYGVELRNAIPLTNEDTVALIHLQKVILGMVVKHYPTPCPPETEDQRAIREDFDLCVIHDSPAARFELKIPDSVPSALKCEVYYSLNGVQKVSYCFKVDTMPCSIGYSRGIQSEPGDECIWAIGMGN
jgi:hypothetical protein